MAKKILLVFGTRPEAIKMAPLFDVLSRNSQFDVSVCVTAQHRQMLDQVLKTFNVSVSHDLDVMRKNQSLNDITVSILSRIKEVLTSERPDLVLVHGDTTTTFATSLACFYEKIKVGHIEAGLRTGDIYSPWPEEMNRKLAASLCNLHFAPTEAARENLLKENVDPDKIFVTGNTVIDALLSAKSKINSSTERLKYVKSQLSKYDINDDFILVTGHRRENFGTGFKNICAALLKIAKNHPTVTIVYPVHLNPAVQKPVLKFLQGVENIRLLPPLEYLPFVYLMDKCKLILTDSGGIQEEAPALGKPVLVLRDTTERPEAIIAGTAQLVGTEPERILSVTSKLLTDQIEYQKFSSANNPYGDGTAAEKIALVISKYVI